MSEVVEKLKVSDSDWKFEEDISNPVRGIRWYTRTIEFSRSLDSDEIKEVKGILQKDPKCPGWTPISSYQLEGAMGKYRFSTCMDSSD